MAAHIMAARIRDANIVDAHTTDANTTTAQVISMTTLHIMTFSMLLLIRHISFALLDCTSYFLYVIPCYQRRSRAGSFRREAEYGGDF